MIYDAGDIHGKQGKWFEIEQILSSGDTIIFNGEFGVGFWENHEQSEEAFYNNIGQKHYTVLFVEGNHENFEMLNRYPISFWNGGRVQKLRPNLIHLMRGEVYEIEGHTVFTFGGGYSSDRCRREERGENISWWPQEMPSEDDISLALTNLQRVDYRVDYIITHSSPHETILYMSKMKKLAIKNPAPEELPLNNFLDLVRDRVTYRRWYFGHFHADAELWRNQTVVYNTIRDLESGAIVKTLK